MRIAIGLARLGRQTAEPEITVAGSPIGHLQVRSVSSISVSLRARFSTSRTEASASGLISLAEAAAAKVGPPG